MGRAAPRRVRRRSPRIQEQIQDGIAAEIIYPSVGMMLCNHPDLAYKKACFDAYNDWIAEWCSSSPDRLLGLGQTAMRTPEEGIDDLERIKALGLRGVMLPGHPGEEDYDSPIYDPVWEAIVDLGLPVSFHILTAGGEKWWRGPNMNGFLGMIHANQDLIGMLVFGGVFERHPAAQGRERRGRRRLGAALHVPHGHVVRAPPQLGAERRCCRASRRSTSARTST